LINRRSSFRRRNAKELERVLSTFLIYKPEPSKVNQLFHQEPILKGKVLRSFELYNMNMAERSYCYPKSSSEQAIFYKLDFKGFKVPAVGREFGLPPVSISSESYNSFLQRFSKRFEDFVLRPSRFAPTAEDLKLATLRLGAQEPFCYGNSAQNKSFGFSFLNSSRLK